MRFDSNDYSVPVRWAHHPIVVKGYWQEVVLCAQGQEEVGRVSGISADAVWLHTEMSDAVRSAGWDNWNLRHREKTSRYAEFRSTAPVQSPGNERSGRSNSLKRKRRSSSPAWCCTDRMAGIQLRQRGSVFDQRRTTPARYGKKPVVAARGAG